MTLGLLGLGAALAAAGTRLSALAFIGAAVVAARGTLLVALGTWTAVTALGFVGLKGSPRRLALPVLGAVAALGVGSARNTAVVGAVWVLATVAAVFSRGRGPDANRWAVTLCMADVPFIGAIVWTAVRVGFEGWPAELDTVAALLLLFAASLRAPLAAGPDDVPEAGLLPVRVQTLAILHVVLATAPLDRDLVVASAVVAACGFAVGGCFRRAISRDTVQEISLVALVLTVGGLGWGPTGWEWAALGAGTLIHNLRLRLDIHPWAPLAASLLRGGGVMLPFLPVLLVGLEGALRADTVAKVAVPVALVAGLAARVAYQEPDPQRRTAPRRWESAAAGVALAGAVAAGVWAPVFTLPSGAAEPIIWPPAWSLGVVAALAILGSVAGRVHRQPTPTARSPLVLADLRLPARWDGGRLLIVLQAALGAVAIGVWVLGSLRGFL